jgi:hypothetical protein
MEGLEYEPNPKHKSPWQAGRRGALCPAWSHGVARDLLESSVLLKTKRFSTIKGWAFVAQQHRPGVWHGYPVPWVEVPQWIWRKWLKEDLVKKQQLDEYWDRCHDLD